MKIKVKKLSSGYYHIRGEGPCNWTQPPRFPCRKEMLEEYSFPEASKSFINSVVEYMKDNYE